MRLKYCLMKRPILHFIPLLAVAAISFAFLQSSEPWTPAQLLEPSQLAKTINDPKAKQPLIYSIGPGAVIKNSEDIGPTQQAENLQKLRAELNKLPKDASLVIYCGCCPFDKCPNIRPAFSLLNEMRFTNHKLLNIRQNIKTNWIDPGYPMAE